MEYNNLFKAAIIAILIILFIKFCTSEKYFISYIFIFFNHFLTITSIALIGRYGEEAAPFLNITVSDPDDLVFFMYTIFSFSSIVIYKYIISNSSLGWDKFFIKRELYGNNKFYFYYIALVLEIIPLIIGKINGGDDFNRFQYTNFVPGKEFFIIYELFFQGISVYFIINSNKLSKMVLIFFMSSFILLFKGNEFGALINQFFWLAIAIRINNILLSKKHIFLGIMILLSIISFKAFNLYQEIEVNNTTASPIIRLLMQGEIFTSVINGLNFDSASSIALNNYFSQFLTGIHARLNSEYGIGNLMVELMGSRGQKMVEDGVALSSGYPGIFIYHFGSFILLAFINPLILLIVVKFLWGNFLRCITFGGMILFAIYFRFFSILMQIPIMGEYEMLTVVNIFGALFISLIIYYRMDILSSIKRGNLRG